MILTCLLNDVLNSNLFRKRGNQIRIYQSHVLFMAQHTECRIYIFSSRKCL